MKKLAAILLAVSFIQQAQAGVDEGIAAYQQMQELINQEVPLIPLAHSLYLYAGRKDLHNLELTPMGGLSFKRAYRD